MAHRRDTPLDGELIVPQTQHLRSGELGRPTARTADSQCGRRVVANTLLVHG
jgi:hypothetical protein